MRPETHHAERTPRKPRQPKDGPRVNPRDPVEEASYESFPASDPPAFGKPVRDGEPIPAGQPVPQAAERERLGRGRGQNMDAASVEEERRADIQAERDAVHERDRTGS